MPRGCSASPHAIDYSQHLGGDSAAMLARESIGATRQFPRGTLSARLCRVGCRVGNKAAPPNCIVCTGLLQEARFGRIRTPPSAFCMPLTAVRRIDQ
jgi:hypothetical protein